MRVIPGVLSVQVLFVYVESSAQSGGIRVTFHRSRCPITDCKPMEGGRVPVQSTDRVFYHVSHEFDIGGRSGELS